MARPTQDPQIRIQEILNTAQSLFYEKGYHQTAISDIAHQMGVAQGTIYYYFKSKEELLDTFIQRDLAAIIAKLRQASARSGLSPLEKIQTVLQQLIRSLYLEEGLFLEFLNNNRTMYLLDNISRQGKVLLEPLLLEIVREGNAQRSFRVPHPKAAVNLIQYIIDSLIFSIYEKESDELLAHQFQLGCHLIVTSLGVTGGTLSVAYR
ncbi:MAG TPA: TetR/AcrR family transcriptional regulator [Patescibacteria group bacterium]|nr:TetR/AcrR family transcriptional regulator [Patescibacteria group bacterium]